MVRTFAVSTSKCLVSSSESTKSSTRQAGTRSRSAAKRLERIREFLASAEVKHVAHKPDDERRIV
jgi:hypothetical protein